MCSDVSQSGLARTSVVQRCDKLPAGTPSLSAHVATRALTIALILLNSLVDAWLESLTRASQASIHSASPRCAMSEADDAPEMAQPAPNPDAQTTVNDFLDYTEFFPSDLVRSLTLIADLDSTYSEAVQHVHALTVQYGKLPALAERERCANRLPSIFKKPSVRESLPTQRPRGFTRSLCATASARLSSRGNFRPSHSRRHAILRPRQSLQVPTDS
jgi:hypothetical protein